MKFSKENGKIEIETNEKLSVHIKNKETGEIFGATNIFTYQYHCLIDFLHNPDWL
jgi:hypothetical protein